MNDPQVNRFFDVWSVYDLVLDCNYMFHNEIFRDVARVLKARFKDRPFSILDLGCGSARHLAAALQGLTVSRYVGCDLSTSALTRAAENLKPLGPVVELREADLLAALETGADPFDVIFSSYALHHLKSADKERFFALAKARLTPHGVLLLVDTAQKEHEDRESSLGAYCQWIASTWDRLEPEPRASVFAHIQSADYPEKSSTMHGLARKHGFSERRDVNSFLWHRTWLFGKAG